jgi:hypothetical protein
MRTIRGLQPDPCGQLGRHVQHVLAGGGQLLGQQVAQPAGAPAAQVRCGQSFAQASSRPACAGQARTRTWPSSSSAAPVATAV